MRADRHLEPWLLELPEVGLVPEAPARQEGVAWPRTAGGQGVVGRDVDGRHGPGETLWGAARSGREVWTLPVL